MLSADTVVYDLQDFLFYQLAQQVACSFSLTIALSRIYYVEFPLYPSEQKNESATFPVVHQYVKDEDFCQ